MSNKQRATSVVGVVPENKQVKEKPAVPNDETAEAPQSSFASYREVIESLVFALFLAFLIKTFEAEAFVIPTGSMAPTLKGRHKDLLCQKCDFPFQVNASEEVDNSSNRSTSSRVVAGTCPQCGFTQYFKDDPVSFTGDRILVNKAAFDCRELRRWDVSVFRAPAEPKINFIKRIVGLPNERLKVEFGDIFVQKKLASGQYGEYEIMRKPLVYLRRMLQTVYDNDYPLVTAESKGWPSRWMDESTSMDQGVVGWTAADEGRTFSTTGRAVKQTTPEGPKQFRCQTPQGNREFDNRDGAMQWLRYRHIVPMASDWFSLVDDNMPPNVLQTKTVRNNPQLITDLTAYNTGMSHDSGRNYDDYSRFIRKISPNDYRCSRSADSFGYNWTG
ncbi:MAG: S26 family signal peptidase, partial [Planctomycetia bacterium]|nr:S26 family signal peptidase [Planctomycetia bacterium]